jgi:sterol desaturase/sphingolipid hydroxylase (fatty acid hydroxylase superfamily)
MRPLPSLAELAIAFAVLGLLFRLVEKRWAWRRVDVVWWFVTPFFSRLAALGAVVTAGVALAVTRRPVGAPWFRAQPLWLQAIEVLITTDFLGYWIHRAFHRRPLWRIHAVHHSSERLDWLAASRVHPLNELITRALQAAPLIVAGFDPRVVAAAIPLLTLHAIFIHADMTWDFGLLRYLVSSPRFHRWHHTSESEGLDRNFAGLFPWIDLLFGTFYMPQGQSPQRFGVREAVPRSFLHQLLYPLRPEPKKIF